MDYKEKLTMAAKLFSDARAILETADLSAEKRA